MACKSNITNQCYVTRLRLRFNLGLRQENVCKAVPKIVLTSPGRNTCRKKTICIPLKMFSKSLKTFRASNKCFKGAQKTYFSPIKELRGL